VEVLSPGLIAPLVWLKCGASLIPGSSRNRSAGTKYRGRPEWHGKLPEGWLKRQYNVSVQVLANPAEFNLSVAQRRLQFSAVQRQMYVGQCNLLMSKSAN
jgi:hypothetical protein